MGNDHDSDSIALAFLERYHRDREAGTLADLASYLALYPAHASRIAREYLLAQGELEPLPSEADASLGWIPGRGAHCGPYVLEELIGAGGQGEVWLARDARLQRRVALKLLRGSEHAPEERLRRFRREAEILSRWNHPSLCAVYDTGIEGRVPWYAMRFVEGPTLAEVLRRAREREGGEHLDDGARLLSIDGVVRCFEALARAAHLAHTHGVVHRDLKPANIVLERDGTPVLLDFGLACDLRDERALTRTGDVLGTPSYMAPEQIEGQTDSIDARTDVWALGVALYETLTLHLPFESATREALCREILAREPVRVRLRDPRASRDLEVVVHTALSKRSSQRYATAEALADDLAAVAAGREIRARRVGVVARLLRWTAREPRLAAAAALAIAASACALVLVGFLAASRADAEIGREVLRERALDVAIGLGFGELGEGDGASAQRRFEDALALDASSAEAAAGIALVHLERRDGARALETLVQHRLVLGERVSARLLRAKALELLRREDEAAREREALPAPRDATDAFLIGQLHLASGHDQETASFHLALDSFTTAILWSRTPRAPYHRARLHAAGHARDGAAIEASAQALRSFWPDTAATPAALGAALLHAGRAREAVDALREARRRDPDSLLVAVHLARALARTGALREAEQVAEEACARGEGRPHVHQVRGEIRLESGALEGARADFEAELRLRPSAPAVRLELSRTLWRLGQRDEAIAGLHAVLAVRPDHVVALANLSSLLLASGAGEEGRELGRRLIAQRGRVDDPSSLGLIAVALDDAGRSVEALALADEIVARFPGEADGHRRRAGFLAARGAIDEAVDAARRAVELAPQRSELRPELALLLHDAGWWREALSELDAHLEGLASAWDLRALHGLWLVEIGSRAPGLAALRAARAAAPRSSRVAAMLAQALYLCGEFQAALHLLDEVPGARAGAAWRERCAASAESLTQVDAIRTEQALPDDVRELLWFAEIACRSGWNLRCARWCVRAAELDPEIAFAVEDELRRALAVACLDAAQREGSGASDAARWIAHALALGETGLATWGPLASRAGAEGMNARAAARAFSATLETAEAASKEARAAWPEVEREAWERLLAQLSALAARR